MQPTPGQRLHALQWIIDSRTFSPGQKKLAKAELLRMLGLNEEKDDDKIVPFIASATPYTLPYKTGTR